MAGINLGFEAGEILFCNSCLRKSESGVPRYVALHSTPPSFFTAHRNMTSASFWPFLTKSCSSMRLINAVGPCPINTGRNIGSPVAVADGAVLACPDGVALPCDKARSTIKSSASSENPNTRMDKYPSGTCRFFKRDLGKIYAVTGVSLLAIRGRKLWCAPPCPKERRVVKCAVNRFPIAETRNPFRRLKHFPYVLAYTEAGWLLQDHFLISLISVCINGNRKLNRTVLLVNSRFLRDKVESTSHPIGGICNDLRRNEIVPFRDVFMVLI